MKVGNIGTYSNIVAQRKIFLKHISKGMKSVKKTFLS